MEVFFVSEMEHEIFFQTFEISASEMTKAKKLKNDLPKKKNQ